VRETIPADWRLYRCPERQIGTQLPIPLSTRLDALAGIGNKAWAPTTRKEVLCAVMLALPPTTRALRKTLNGYQSATVADAFVEGWEDWRFLYPPTSPGPRVQLNLFQEVPVPEPHCDPGELLSTAAAYRIGMIIASPLAGRIDLLVELVNSAGQRTTRKELIAAAILAAPLDETRLARQLHTYWHATAADTAIAGQPTESIFEWPSPHTHAKQRRPRSKPRTPSLDSPIPSAPSNARRTRKRVVPPPDPPH
jgi:hypothetical protein